MDKRNPETWKCPNDWLPDSDGEWEISELKNLGSLILEASPDYEVAINTEDYTAIYFEVLKHNKKLAEVYVNRAETDLDKPLFSVFYGITEEEIHTTDYHRIIEELSRTT